MTDVNKLETQEDEVPQTAGPLSASPEPDRLAALPSTAPDDVDYPLQGLVETPLEHDVDMAPIVSGLPKAGLLTRIRGKLRRKPEATTTVEVVFAGAEAPVSEKRKRQANPLRILIGFMPEVTERDARDYALGVAEKHFDQPALAFFDAYKYSTGYAYEVHEGGSGHAYLPEIIKHFNEQGEYVAGEGLTVILRTGTRMVQVQRERYGLSAILLPESSKAQPSEFLVPHKKLTPALTQRTGFLVAGSAFFITGFFALIVGSVMTRYQAYEEPLAPVVTRVNFEDLPSTQWSRIESLPPNSYVAKIVYENKKWVRDIRNEAQVASVEPPPPLNASKPASLAQPASAKD